MLAWYTSSPALMRNFRILRVLDKLELGADAHEKHDHRLHQRLCSATSKISGIEAKLSA